MKDEIRLLDRARRILDSMRTTRRDLHRHPELGTREVRTAALIAEKLGRLGLEVRTGVGGTGVVGILRGGVGRERTVALRADMDALPMQDLKEVSYASEVPGVAHACGHDAHTAIQLGAAELLSSMAGELPGNVTFIFQPSEDTLPGGALPMLEAGVLEDPRVGAVFSLHLGSQFDEGQVVARPGSVSTSSVSFTLGIRGRGGHIGEPQRVINPVLLAAAVITAAESTIPKRVAPGDPVIFDFCSVHGGTVGNIVPEEVTLQGGLRVASPELLDELIGKFEALARGIVENAGGKCELGLQRGYPTIHNDPELFELWKAAAAKVVGAGQVLVYDRMVTGGDDAAYFHMRVPGIYWFLGIRDPEAGYTEPLHSPHFDFNEEVMALGAAVQAQAALDYLRDSGSGERVAPHRGQRAG
jgi:amidohydrolase